MMVRMGDDQCTKVGPPPANESEAPVDDRLVHDKINKAIGHDSVSRHSQKGKPQLVTTKDRKKTRDRKNQSEAVIFLQAALVRVVVICVQIPQESVH